MFYFGSKYLIRKYIKKPPVILVHDFAPVTINTHNQE